MSATESFDYDATYYEGKMSGWTETSFDSISGKLRTALQRHEYPKNGVALDYGCGVGVYCPLLLATGLKVVGADISPSALEAARGQPYGGTFLLSDHRVPLEGGSVSVLFTTEVLEHIEDDQGAVAEFSRLIAPGGLVVLTTTLYFSSINTYLSTAIIQKHSPVVVLSQICAYLSGFFSVRRQKAFIKRWCFVPLGGHFHGFHIRQLRRLLVMNGFEVRELAPLFIFKPFGVGRWLDPKFLKTAPFRKRLIWTVPMLCSEAINFLLKGFKFTANNIFIVARRRADSSNAR
ncbi:MAG: class I SAM-dependent methyltransferase [Verrucomicrobiota bacterium]